MFETLSLSVKRGEVVSCEVHGIAAAVERCQEMWVRAQLWRGHWTFRTLFLESNKSSLGWQCETKASTLLDLKDDRVLHWRCGKLKHFWLLQQDHGQVAGKRVQAGLQGAPGLHLLLLRHQHDLQNDHRTKEWVQPGFWRRHLHEVENPPGALWTGVFSWKYDIGGGALKTESIRWGCKSAASSSSSPDEALHQRQLEAVSAHFFAWILRKRPNMIIEEKKGHSSTLRTIPRFGLSLKFAFPSF